MDAGLLPSQARRRREAAAGTWLGFGPARAVAGWLALSERFGKLPFGDLLEPAIDIAERGYAVPVVVQQKWAAATPLLKAMPGWAEAFLPRGRAPEVAEHFAFPAAARSLRAIQASRGAALYGGEIAEAAAAHSRANGGAIEVADFAGYRPEWVEPIGIDAYGHRVHEIPPNGQGIARWAQASCASSTSPMPVDGADAATCRSRR